MFSQHLYRPELLIASNNAHKVAEFRRLFEHLPFDLLTPADLGLELEVEETGETVQENAILKARAFSEAADMPALADDSGIEVDALNGAPGVRSARYGGPGLDDQELVAEGRCEGEVARAPIGENGFGYDPVFFVPDFDKTMAQLSPHEMDQISHRGIATRAMAAALAEHVGLL